LTYRRKLLKIWKNRIPNMLTLGIDPGTATTGWGIIDSSNNMMKALAYGHIATKTIYPLPKRLHIIHTSLLDIIKKYSPDNASVEELFFSKNVKTAISVGHARGVILLTAQLSGLKTFEYTPLQIKQAVSGYGRADKQQIQTMVKSLLKLEKIPSPDDTADALAVAICHINRKKWQDIIQKNSLKGRL